VVLVPLVVSTVPGCMSSESAKLGAEAVASQLLLVGVNIVDSTILGCGKHRMPSCDVA
jgi:hypothetical protein